MKKFTLLVATLIVGIVIIGSLMVILNPASDDTGTSPPAAETAEIEYENASEDDLVLQSPVAGSVISSPIALAGEARGSWYFEAVAGVKITDANGSVLGEGIVTAQSDWMTTDFVSFIGAISFSAPATTTGYIVFEKENPSGLPANNASVSVPITF